MRKAGFLLFVLLFGVLLSAGPCVSAQMISDPSGDLFDRQGKPVEGEKYLDIVGAEVAQTELLYLIRFKVADAMPVTVANESIWIEWDLLVDYDQNPATWSWSWFLFDQGIGVDVLARIGLRSRGYVGEALSWVDTKTQTQNLEYRLEGNTAELRVPRSMVQVKAFDFFFATRKYVGNTMVVADRCPNDGHFTFLNGKVYYVPRKVSKPVVVTDFSMYKGSLDSYYRPLSRVCGYYRNEATARVYMRVGYFEDMPEVVGIGRWYGPDGSLVHEGVGKFSPRKAGDSSIWTFSTDKIGQINPNVGIWRVEMYCGPHLLFVEYFTMGDYLVDASLTGLAGKYPAKLFVDGKEAGTIRAGQTKPLALAMGAHTVSMEPATVAGTPGMQYVAQSKPWSVSSEGSYTFQYSTEYYLSINSPKGKATGSGWYKEGSKATFSAEAQVTGAPGTRYLFSKWTGDFDGASPDGTIAMDGPKNITASYKTQHALTVQSEYGNPQGSGWYDEGATAKFSVTSTPIPVSGFMGSLGAKTIFERWSGDSTVAAETATVTMNSPKKVVAVWTTDYGQAYMILGGVVVLIVVIGVVLAMKMRKPTPKS